MSLFKIRRRPIELRLTHVFTISRGSKPTVRNVFLELQSQNITGNGEAAPNSRYNENAAGVMKALDRFPPGVLDHVSDPGDMSAAIGRWIGYNGGPFPHSARAALEMAWLDWWAKKQQRALWKIWEAPSMKGPVTSFTIGLDEPRVMQEKIREAREYPILKIKLGSGRDREIMDAIREVTDKPVRVDANEGWQTLEEAKRAIEYLSDKNVQMVEQPMPAGSHRQMEKLKEFSPIPLCADESFKGEEDLDRIAHSFEIINIKIMKIGSLVRALEVIQKARRIGLKIMIGCMIESSLANTAGALLSLWADYADLDGHLLIEDDPFDGLYLDGEKRIVLSNRNGLGARPRHDFFKDNPE
ncbi:MAG: dipeptide epimerase [Balneolaceae bacterium]|nr:dipeptide epimerase [Balneolaceae bacterium]